MSLWARWLGEVRNLARQALFLPRCKICESDLVWSDETLICRVCRSHIRLYERATCQTCGKFLPPADRFCGSCAIATPPFSRHASYAAYEGELKDLILLYKFAGIESFKHLFSELYLELYQQRALAPADGIIPVPADPGRRREFAPVGETARLLARRLNLPLFDRCLHKTRSTPPQVGLAAKQRLKNLRGAFQVRDKDLLKGKTVLLLDDVYTTGATIRTCSQVLRKAGASVIALTLAQSLRQ